MNIIIPLGGIGSRFQNDGYRMPKPLIRVLGKPLLFWIMDSLDLNKDDMIYIPYHPSLESFDLGANIDKRYGQENVKTWPLEKETRGAAETIYIACQKIPEYRKMMKTISMDGDTCYTCNILAKCRALKNNMNGTICFYDRDDKPIYSYVELETEIDQQYTLDNQCVKSLREKEKISSWANTGCYTFISSQNVISLYDKLYERNSLLVGFDQKEIYISHLLDFAIKHGQTVVGNSISRSDFHVLGTPIQLKTFASLSNISFENICSSEDLRVCFDLDQTLVTLPREKGNYDSVNPIERNIAILRQLKSMGHYIIIYTARGMVSYQGNIGKIQKHVLPQITKTLQKYDIPYDEIHVGKPYADLYIDDSSIDPRTCDLRKELGIYNTKIEERCFNKVTSKSLPVIEKTSQNVVKLEGEIQYYKNLPESVSHLFPRFYGQIQNGYQMERINGLSLSYMYVDRSLTPIIFKNVIDSLEDIHSHRCNISLTDKYANHSKKMVSRINSNKKLYDNLNILHHIEEVKTQLEKYENANKGIFCMIHGDPVFTNILIDSQNNLKFVDMRGMVGDETTVYGDNYYDYAKLLQSIMGYDHIISKNNIPTMSIKTPFLNILWEKCGDEKDNVVILCASLVISMIPLHDPQFHDHFVKLLDDIMNLHQ